MQKIHLSPAEELELELLLASMSRKANYSITLSSLLDNWENFVSEVEEGYNDSIYEYTNDLSARNLLQLLVENSSLAFRNKLIGVLQGLDERFKQATEESNYLVLNIQKKSQGWWWFRIPIKMGPELKNDFQIEGKI
jgi:hypothetical protein